MHPNTETPDAKTRAAALAAFLFLAAVACLSVALLGPPRAVPEGAPPADFSSGRAMRHVREMTRAPRPTGTAENERVRAYLLGELRAVGEHGRDAGKSAAAALILPAPDSRLKTPD